MKVKKNDTVLVLTGKDAGKTGKVLVAMPKSERVIVEGVNLQKKHKKARSAQEQSSIITTEGAIAVSNVEVICPVCKKATRVGYSVVDGKKVRICKKCGASLEAKKEVEKKKTSKKAEAVEGEVKAPAKKKTTAKKTTKKVEAVEAENA